MVRFKARPIVHTINPVRFALAFVGAPLLVTVGLFWVFLIPVVALEYGLPFWIAFALPFLLWNLPRFGADKPLIGWLTLLGFTAGVIQLPYYRAGDNSLELQTHLNLVAIWLGLCTVHAAVWAVVFCSIYNRRNLKEGDQR